MLEKVVIQILLDRIQNLAYYRVRFLFGVVELLVVAESRPLRLLADEHCSGGYEAIQIVTEVPLLVHQNLFSRTMRAPGLDVLPSLVSCPNYTRNEPSAIVHFLVTEA
jgi:hypothetical protein